METNIMMKEKMETAREFLARITEILGAEVELNVSAEENNVLNKWGRNKWGRNKWGTNGDGVICCKTS